MCCGPVLLLLLMMIANPIHYSKLEAQDTETKREAQHTKPLLNACHTATKLLPFFPARQRAQFQPNRTADVCTNITAKRTASSLHTHTNPPSLPRR
jgi:hypothetical protein